MWIVKWVIKFSSWVLFVKFVKVILMMSSNLITRTKKLLIFISVCLFIYLILFKLGNILKKLYQNENNASYNFCLFIVQNIVVNVKINLALKSNLMSSPKETWNRNWKIGMFLLLDFCAKRVNYNTIRRKWNNFKIFLYA